MGARAAIGGVLAIVAALVGCGAFSGSEEPAAPTPAPSGDAGGVQPGPPDDGGVAEGGATDAAPDGGDPQVGANETLVQAFRFDVTCAALEKVQNAVVSVVPGKVGNGCRVCYSAEGADTRAIVRASFGAPRSGVYHARLWARQAPAPAFSFPSATVGLGDGAVGTTETPLALAVAWSITSVDASLKGTAGFVELKLDASGTTSATPCAEIDTILVTMDR